MARNWLEIGDCMDKLSDDNFTYKPSVFVIILKSVTESAFLCDSGFCEGGARVTGATWHWRCGVGRLGIIESTTAIYMRNGTQFPSATDAAASTVGAISKIISPRKRRQLLFTVNMYSCR